MKSLFLLIWTLICCSMCADTVQGVDSSPLLPLRGYPEPLPFTKTECLLVSMHIPTIENPPSALSEMPRGMDVDAGWDHTKEGDVVYDITGWFPLDEMRDSDEGEDERWVYYNASSGYVIAYADQFLQSSIYDYIRESIVRHGVTYRVSMSYIEIDDEVPIDIKVIKNYDYKTLMRYSGACSSGGVIEWQSDVGSFKLEAYKVKDDVNSVVLDLKLKEGRCLEQRLYLHSDEWMMYECGISSKGKRGVMIAKCECENRLGQRVSFPTDKELFLDIPEGDRACDPFADRVGAYYVGYEVPIDAIRLLYSSEEEKEDPFGDYELPEKYRGERVDVSELLLDQGIEARAVFSRRSSMIVVYTTEVNHVKMEELFSWLGPHRTVSYMVKLNFYDVDVRNTSEKYEWSVEDVLARNPKKLASIGSMQVSGQRVDMKRNDSECEIELIPDEYGKGVGLNLKVHLDLPQLKLDSEENVTVRFDVPKIVKLEDRGDGRVLVMMAHVQKVNDSDDFFEE